MNLINELNGRLQNGISFKKQIEILKKAPHKKWITFNFVFEVFGIPISTLTLSLTSFWGHLHYRMTTMDPDSKIFLFASIFMLILFLVSIVMIYKKRWKFFMVGTSV
jgi:hypothetical protein